ncbi:MAG: S41 family peptidase [Gaiellales bacterium]
MKRAGGFAFVLLLLVAAFLLGLLSTRLSDEPSSARLEDRLRDRDRPAVAINQVRQELVSAYYRPVPEQVLYEPTISGILRELGDPYTDYLTPAEYAALRNRTARSYTGVGLSVAPSKSGLLVTSTYGGPARKAGIRRGDMIVRIQGRPAGGLSFEQSLSLITGEKGTLVRLTVKRARQGAIHFALVRQEIDVPSVDGRLVRVRGAELGYVRLLSFPAGSAGRLERATRRLVRQGAKGLIVDLRDNPGGLISQAVETVSLFVEKGVVCTTAGLHQERRVFQASGDVRFPSLPVVVLVNPSSASAAEIVAAALQEHDRAVVVGRRTFGKASVQSVRPLSNGGALKLTTATYLTPRGVDLAEAGVRPNIRAFDDLRTRTDEALTRARRALLQLLR